MARRGGTDDTGTRAASGLCASSPRVLLPTGWSAWGAMSTHITGTTPCRQACTWSANISLILAGDGEHETALACAGPFGPGQPRSRGVRAELARPAGFKLRSRCHGRWKRALRVRRGAAISEPASRPSRRNCDGPRSRPYASMPKS